MADNLSLPEDTAPSVNDVVRLEGVTGSTNIVRRCKPGNLRVLDTGGSTTQTLSTWAADVTTAKANIVIGQVQLPGTGGTITTSATTTGVEYGTGPNHFTKLTLTAFAVGTGSDNASLGIGAKFFTFPAGTILIKKTTMVGGLTLAANVTTGSPEVGIGTVIASGAISVLSGTATFEDVIDGNASGGTYGAITGTLAGVAFYKSSDSTTRDGVIIKASGGATHDLFLNVAVAWPDSASGTLAVTYTGVICLEWALID